MTDEERELAKCSDFDIWIEDHGLMTLSGSFEYEGGSVQGLGYIINMEFVRAFMDALGVERLNDVKGESCWVTHDNHHVSKIEPLHKKDGKAFNIDKFIETQKSK